MGPEAAGAAKLLVLTFLNGCIAALNCIVGDMKSNAHASSRRPTHAQEQVHLYLAERVWGFLGRMRAVAADKFCWRGVFAQSFDAQESRPYPEMKADAVDLPDAAATCDPMALPGQSLCHSVSSRAALFPHGLHDLWQDKARFHVDRAEYTKLVGRQLRCGKLGLSRHVEAVGDTFCVPKHDGARLREVWNGSSISQAAVPPPAPEFLANPSCFVDLVMREGEEIFLSKRDVAACFDTLHGPSDLQLLFGRPPVSMDELQRHAGCTAADIKNFMVESSGLDVAQHAGSSLLYPVSRAWPMGFSWSSCVAQGCVIECCRSAGVQESAFLCLDLPPPMGSEAVGVATDDIFMIHRDRALAAERLQRLDAALHQYRMPKNAAKDVDMERSMIALGCELCSVARRVDPAKEKVVTMFAAWVDLLLNPFASPVAVGRAPGLQQWFCLLARPMYCIVDSIYEYVRRQPEDLVQRVPLSVRDEIAVALFLMPLLGADLSRDFLPQLTACDASGLYGFGVSYLKVPRALAEFTGCLAERRGDYVKFYVPDGEEAPKDRIGKPHVLPFARSCFKTAMSTRARWKAHSSSLEANALLLALKWLLRKPANFHHRLVLLVDAKAVLGAAVKGRTSAPGLRRCLRQIGALSLATNSLLRIVYVPSEYNPADAPSRGKLVRKPNRQKRRSNRSRLGTLTERRLATMAARLDRLYDIWGPDL